MDRRGREEEQPRRGRLAPDAMFPAGAAAVRGRRVTLPDGLTLRVAESGDAAAPPVLLLHGWGASIYMWRDWFAPLAAAGWRPVAIDLPGHGLSDRPGAQGAYALDRQVAMLRELIEGERLVGAPIVAQSMGGTIALELALAPNSPVGPLVLVNPANFGRVGLVSLARWVSPPFVDPLLARLVPRWVVARAHRLAYTQPARISARDIDEYWAPSQFPGYPVAMRRLLHEFAWGRAPAGELAERMRGIGRPVLVILGGRDALVRDAGSYAAALERAGAPLELHVVAEGGHALNEEEPEVVVARVLEFLRGKG